MINLEHVQLTSALKDNLLSLNLSLEENSENQDIIDLLTKTVLSKKGKRIRPLLLLLMGDLFDLSKEDTLPYAQIVEKIHAAALAHDDVIDMATSRRGLPSINVLASNKLAILAGDYLLAQVFEDFSNLQHHQIFKETAKTIKELFLGEWQQHLLGQLEHPSTKEEIIEVNLKKTGALFGWCCQVPAILSNQSKETTDLALTFGQSLGLAFQLIDDIYDYRPESESGKNSLQDQNNGILNLILFEYFQGKTEEFKNWRKKKTKIDLSDSESFAKAHAKVSSEIIYRLDLSLGYLNNLEDLLKKGNKSYNLDAFSSIIVLIRYLKDLL